MEQNGKLKMNSNARRFQTHSTNTKQSTNVHSDDWDTDPDFIHDIDEMEQRWGPKRTGGSINMSELINEVRQDHEKMREKFQHPSQRDHSEGFGGKFGVQRDRMDPSAQNYDYQEELSKHTSQEISRKVIKSSMSNSSIGGSNTDISDIRRKFFEKEESSSSSMNPNETRPMRTYQTHSTASTTKKPQLPTKSANLFNSSSFNQSSKPSSSSSGYTSFVQTDAKSPSQVEKKTSSKQHEYETKRTSHSSYDSATGASRSEPFDGAYKSIKDKIDAFKKEFEDIENKVANKVDLSKVIKKTTKEVEKSNVQYVSRSDSGLDNDDGSMMQTRPATTKSSINQRDLPSTSIKSLSEKFENLCRQDGEEFRRQTESKRREFFDKIENQVRETRKNLDGFDPIDEDFDRLKRPGRTEEPRLSPVSKVSASISPPTGRSGYSGPSSPLGPSSPRNASASPSSRPSSRLGSEYASSTSRPKVYTRSETTKEEIVSKVVKQNDRVIENETKRNVEHTSSCHGSSEDENEDRFLRSPRSPQSPNNIRSLDREFRSSPLGSRHVESPIDELKRRVPVVEPELKGAGLMARTLYDYQAAEDDELTFDVDDLITNIEKVDPGWYKGVITYKNGTKKEGLFPANHVRLLNDTSEH